jgi:hypothetical protein
MRSKQDLIGPASKRLALALGLLLISSALLISIAPRLAWADDDVPGPTLVIPPPPPVVPAPATAPATAPAAPAAVVTSAPAPLPPTDETLLRNMLEPSGNGTTGAPTVGGAAVVTATPSIVPHTPGIAPKQPAVSRIREGDSITKRLGRLVKDEKTGQWLFAFEADGKVMQDPPMGLIPCRMLQEMEAATLDGTKPIKFTVSGIVTEYRNKNYLYVTYEQTVRDLNQF